MQAKSPVLPSIDTSRTILIDHSPARTLAMILVSVVMTALSIFITIPLQGEEPGGFLQVVGWVGAVFFGVCAVAWASRLFARAMAVTIGPDGLRDTRVARETIPWRAIERISTWTMQGQSVLVVAVAPEVERRLSLTTIARWTRRPNRALGADGLCIIAAGLKMDFPTLEATVRAYAAAARD